MAATARKTSFVWNSYEVGRFLAYGRLGSQPIVAAVYPGFGSMYRRFHTAWWDH